ncbi:A disintegrin and metalloproteinase with thrombospondin motifs 6 [Halotydeus destructor]|nr:A disintegrin and metalloproteinase with thrombospondin motifs 6 [Halotydeus destructor]
MSDNGQFGDIQGRHNDISQVEFCDLSFINDEDKKKAHSQFLSVKLDREASSNLTNELFRNSRPRKKRETQKLRTIETAIFVDQQLNQRFQGRSSDLKRLVMATMAEVQLIYQYKSMSTPVKIVIVKYEVLQDQNGLNDAGGDIDKYLDNFCSWQARKLRTLEQSSKWDHALLLSGLDLYKDTSGKRNKKVLGLAWVNGMCKPTYSCTLNEGKSFEAAFVIAHEMGHSLGILHDGRGNNCEGDKFIMSEKTGPGKVNWSPCSNRYLENFLSLPGEQYTADLQCQLALGQQYKAYHSAKEPFNDICRELWCLSGSWATPAHPALEGSSCGKNGEKCFQGKCLAKNDRSAAQRNPPSTTNSGNINRRSVAGTNRNQARDKPRRSRTPARSVKVGFGFGLVNSDRLNRPIRTSLGSTFGHIPPLASTPAYSARSSPVLKMAEQLNGKEETSNKESEEEAPVFTRVTGFFKSILPEANKFINLFNFSS